MNGYLKHLVAAAAAALLFAGQALAACPDGACAGKGNPESCPYKGHKPAHHMSQQVSKVPGASNSYVHRILAKGEQIGLSDEQRKQIEEILIAAEKESAEADARADAVVAEFYGKLRAKKAGAAEIDAYAKRMGELYAARLKANLNASTKASNLLSAEQKEKFYAGKK